MVGHGHVSSGWPGWGDVMVVDGGRYSGWWMVNVAGGGWWTLQVASEWGHAIMSGQR